MPVRISVNQFKKGFFDRQAVISATDRAERGVLSKFGAYVRRAAKSSIRKRKGISNPGDPPSSHTGILRDFIFFAYDAVRRSVVIGPALANMVFFNRDRKPVKGTVPEVLEFGGEINILEINKGAGWRRADLRSKRRNEGFPTRLRAAHVDARPYMNPVFEAESAKLPALWRDSIK